MLRALDVLAVLFFLANAYILGNRGYELITGDVNGDFLLLRSAVEVFWSVLALGFLGWRYIPRQAGNAM